MRTDGPENPSNNPPALPEPDQAPENLPPSREDGRGTSSAEDEGGPSLDDRERRIDEDYEWCLHDPGIRLAYGGKVVVVHQRTIWGVGSTHAAAWEAARQRPGCPSRESLAVVAVPHLVAEKC